MARRMKKEAKPNERILVIGAPMAGKSLFLNDFARYYGKGTYVIPIDDRIHDYEGLDVWEPEIESRKGEHLNARIIKDKVAQDAADGVFLQCGSLIMDSITPIFDHEVRSVLDDKQKKEKSNYTGKANSMKFLVEAGKLTGLPVAYVIHRVVSGDQRGNMSARNSISRIEQHRMYGDLTLVLEIIGPATYDFLSDAFKDNMGAMQSASELSAADLSKLKAGHYGVRVERWRDNMTIKPFILWDEVGHFKGMYERILNTLRNVGAKDWTWGDPFRDEDHAINAGIMHSEESLGHQLYAFGNPGEDAIRSNGERGINGEVNIAMAAMGKLKRGDYTWQTKAIDPSDMKTLSRAWVKLVNDKIGVQREILGLLSVGPRSWDEIKAAVNSEYTDNIAKIMAKDGHITKTKDGMIELVGGVK